MNTFIIVVSVPVHSLNLILYEVYFANLHDGWGPGVAKWLTRCATSWTVPGSIPGDVTGDFYRGSF